MFFADTYIMLFHVFFADTSANTRMASALAMAPITTRMADLSLVCITLMRSPFDLVYIKMAIRPTTTRMADLLLVRINLMPI